MGKLATRNNTREVFEHANDISGEVIQEQYTERNVACLRCPVACGKLVHVPRGEFAEQASKCRSMRPSMPLGPCWKTVTWSQFLTANAMCDEMGLDTISMGVTLAFTAECLEKGIVTAEEFGADLAFGDGANIPELVRLTALKEGPGRIVVAWLGTAGPNVGVRIPASFYILCRGWKLPDIRRAAFVRWDWAYATSTRGGSHHDAGPNYIEPNGDPGFEGQASVLRQQPALYQLLAIRWSPVGSSAKRGLGSPFDESIQDIIRAVTGWEIDMDEIRTIGERIYNLERLINVRRGRDRSKDTLPYRVTHEPISAGPSEGRYCPQDVFQQLLDEYYQLRGWDAQGKPTAQKTSRTWIIDILNLMCHRRMFRSTASACRRQN